MQSALPTKKAGIRHGGQSLLSFIDSAKVTSKKRTKLRVRISYLIRCGTSSTESAMNSPATSQTTFYRVVLYANTKKDLWYVNDPLLIRDTGATSIRAQNGMKLCTAKSAFMYPTISTELGDEAVGHSNKRMKTNTDQRVAQCDCFSQENRSMHSQSKKKKIQIKTNNTDTHSTYPPTQC